MDFEISHTLAAPVARVATALLDPRYQQSLSGVGPLAERRVLDQTSTSDGRVRRRLRCVLAVDLSGAARKILGDAQPAWVEDALWHPEKSLWEWRIIPEVAAELLVSHGDIRLLPADAGTERVVAGKVQVRVPFYGGRVESAIVDGLRRAYDAEASHLTAWLDGTT